MYSHRIYRGFAPVQNFLHGPLCPHARGYGAAWQAGSDLVCSAAIVLFWSIYVLAVPFCISDQMECMVALRLCKIFCTGPCVLIDVDMGHESRLGVAWSGVQPSFSFQVFMCWPCSFAYWIKWFIWLLCACPKFFAWPPVSSLTWIWGSMATWE